MITLECILIKGRNDSAQDADKLAQIAKLLKARVNLIAYSEIPKKEFQSPEKEDIEIFMKRLKRRGVKVTLRQSKGEDIQAACGQLAGKKENQDMGEIDLRKIRVELNRGVTENTVTENTCCFCIVWYNQENCLRQ